MTTANLTDNDLRLRNAVSKRLEWDPEVDASAVGVSVKGAAVTLTGFIDSYSAKLAAERSAKRVQGVRAVANDIEVRAHLGQTDEDIARNASQALQVRSTVPASVQAAVHHGVVSLTGRCTGCSRRRPQRRPSGTCVECVEFSTTSAWRPRLP